MSLSEITPEMEAEAARNPGGGMLAPMDALPANFVPIRIIQVTLKRKRALVTMMLYP